MQAAPTALISSAQDRVAWVDYAKGVCILLVVMFHTVNHYEEAVGATGWMRRNRGGEVSCLRGSRR